MSFDDYYAAQDIIEDLLRKDLIGPVEKDEVLSELPLEVYSMGILWPQRTTAEKLKVYEGASEAVIEEIAAQQNEFVDIDVVEDLDDELESNHGKINAANTYRPSAMALTFVVDAKEEFLNVRFKCATYLHHEEELVYEKKTKDESGEEIIDTRKRVVSRYTRNPIDCGEVIFDLKTERASEPNNIPRNIDLDLFIRKTYEDGSRLVTISATNNIKAQNREIVQNTSALFQCELSVVSTEGFHPLKQDVSCQYDIETQTLEMIYRDLKNYASGHGCSVKWTEKEGKVYALESEFMPVAEIVQMNPRPKKFSDLNCFLLQYWTNSIRTQGCDELSRFVGLYEAWLVSQKKKAKKISYAEAAANCFCQIDECIVRLKKGIECLRSNDHAWMSFLYMNEAMLLQRVNYEKTKRRFVDPSTVEWYPFQLAFILQIIPDIVWGKVDDEKDWHDIVDLLWFPTGGGKTEAYLGLSAFVIFFRRLSKGETSDGVTIIMRYTLRLLTAQQFERATALICACEYLRQKYAIPGKEISIGLWVGLDLTPNQLSQAEESINKIKEGEFVHKRNPVQIFHCPFCGSDIDVGNYTIDSTMKIKCPDKDCFFVNGLPIYVVDDDIYKMRPTLLLSTIDKFARIVWEERTVAIFGSDNQTLPPELIIQDELHLISGPLGSISGVYEAAVDALCTRNSVKPKIIASTATVRNATKQIMNLYNRGSFQFPPTGIDINDSFFAETADKNLKPVRRYIGLCETGGSMIDIFVRVYGCLFFAQSYLEGIGTDVDVIDQYFTVVGYFNSLKDLGSSATVIIDRVNTQSEALRLHKFKTLANEVGLTKLNLHWEHNELTSRKSSREIKDALEELEIKYPDERAYSYVLASNMLSVGIDINRLGVMTVYSQPKTNAEYIQATSRVGRSKPGIVLCLYNSMRSRDRSHYEQFTYYHNTFYKHVEPTSVTPFSFRSIEKALHAVYVALIRHEIPEMRGNEDVVNYDRNDLRVQKIKEYILERVGCIDRSALEYSKDWLDCFEEQWERDVNQKEESFVYSLKNNMPDTTYTLLVEAEKDNLSYYPSTLNSLRNVDTSSNVFILSRNEEEGQE